MQIVFNTAKRKNGKSLNFEKIKNKFLSLAHNFNEIFFRRNKKYGTYNYSKQNIRNTKLQSYA